MSKYNLSEIMKKAWAIKKQNKLNVFSICLKMAWEDAKSMEQKTITVTYKDFKNYYQDNKIKDIKGTYDATTKTIQVESNEKARLIQALLKNNKADEISDFLKTVNELEQYKAMLFIVQETIEAGKPNGTMLVRCGVTFSSDMYSQYDSVVEEYENEKDLSVFETYKNKLEKRIARRNEKVNSII